MQSSDAHRSSSPGSELPFLLRSSPLNSCTRILSAPHQTPASAPASTTQPHKSSHTPSSPGAHLPKRATPLPPLKCSLCYPNVIQTASPQVPSSVDACNSPSSKCLIPVSHLILPPPSPIPLHHTISTLALKHKIPEIPNSTPPSAESSPPPPYRYGRSLLAIPSSGVSPHPLSIGEGACRTHGKLTAHDQHSGQSPHWPILTVSRLRGWSAGFLLTYPCPAHGLTTPLKIMKARNQKDSGTRKRVWRTDCALSGPP